MSRDPARPPMGLSENIIIVPRDEDARPPEDVGVRYCNCADPENCREPIPGYVCRPRAYPPAAEADALARLRQENEQQCRTDQEDPRFLVHVTHPAFTYRCYCGGKWDTSPDEAVKQLEAELARVTAEHEHACREWLQRIAEAHNAKADAERRLAEMTAERTADQAAGARMRNELIIACNAAERRAAQAAEALQTYGQHKGTCDVVAVARERASGYFHSPAAICTCKFAEALAAVRPGAPSGKNGAQNASE